MFLRSLQIASEPIDPTIEIANNTKCIKWVGFKNEPNFKKVCVSLLATFY
jgi:hypothetical protein